MQMRTEFLATRNYFDDAIAQLLGIERTDPYSFERASLGDHLEQVGQLNRRLEVLAVATEMHSGEDDLADAARVKIVQRRHHASRLDAAGTAARERHDTEGAELIASLLQLKERARMTVERHRGHLDRRLLPAQIRDHHALDRAQSHRTLELVEPSKPDDGVDFGCLSQNIRARLRQASGHHDARLGIEPARTPRKPQAFDVGAIGNRASIDDINVGAIGELATRHAARAQSRLKYRRIVLIDLASERRDRIRVSHAYAVLTARSMNPPPSTSSPR